MTEMINLLLTVREERLIASKKIRIERYGIYLTMHPDIKEEFDALNQGDNFVKLIFKTAYDKHHFDYELTKTKEFKDLKVIRTTIKAALASIPASPRED